MCERRARGGCRGRGRGGRRNNEVEEIDFIDEDSDETEEEDI